MVDFLSKIKEITTIAIFVISLILLRKFTIIVKMYVNYQIYDFSDKLSFFVCTKSSRSRNLESIGSIVIYLSQKKYMNLE